jgi:hypothetical protein
VSFYIWAYPPPDPTQAHQSKEWVIREVAGVLLDTQAIWMTWRVSGVEVWVKATHDTVGMPEGADLQRLVEASKEIAPPSADADNGSGSLEFIAPGPGGPMLIGGQRVSLDEAIRDSTFPIIRPQHEKASDASLLEVWRQPKTGEVGLKYASGVTAYLTIWPPNAARDPATFYADMVKETGAGWTQSFGDHPGWVIPANSQSDGAPPESVVLLTIDQVEIALHGEVSADELVAIAASVRA